MKIKFIIFFVFIAAVVIGTKFFLLSTDAPASAISSDRHTAGRNDEHIFHVV